MARFVGFVLVSAFAFNAYAGFKDPFDSAAGMTALAGTTRLTAVARAGSALVAVGPLGRIVLSRDAGKTWVQAPSPVSSDLTAVRFVTSDLGWAVGHEGVVLNTRDGGATWTKQLDGNGVAAATLAEAERRPEQQSDEAKKAVDYAKRLVEDGPDKAFFDVLFLNENEGFVVGAFNLAMRTRDGGRSWVPLGDRTSNPDGYHLYSLTASKDGVFLAGEHGLLRRWSAESQRFEALPSPYQGSYFGIIAQDAHLFAFGMRGNAFQSEDGGRNWKKVDTQSSTSINGGVALGGKRVVMATQGGVLLVSVDDGATFSPQSGPVSLPYAGIAAAGDSAVAVVGPFGVRVEAIR